MRELVLHSLSEDKAEDIEVIPLHDQHALADDMIIACGRSSRQVAAIASKLRDRLNEAGYKNVHIEGMRHGDWVVVDVGDIIVHVFRPEVRAFYNIEKMWRAGSILDIVSPDSTART
jgi:ribosome-associated protein